MQKDVAQQREKYFFLGRGPEKIYQNKPKASVSGFVPVPTATSQQGHYLME